jgi:DNA repair protein RadC
MKIALLPPESRPREKARREGIASLSDEEVLALILSRGVKGASALDLAREILARYGSFSSLGAAPSESLMEIKGIKEAKALEIAALFEVARRAAKEAPQSQDSPAEELYEHYHLSLEDEIGEKGLLLLYDRRGRFLKEKILFAGNENRLSASPKLVLSEALSSRASSFVFLHNHPSGNPYPSPDDFSFTSSLEKKASDLSLHFRDHIIVAEGRFFSFRENGLL